MLAKTTSMTFADRERLSMPRTWVASFSCHQSWRGHGAWRMEYGALPPLLARAATSSGCSCEPHNEGLGQLQRMQCFAEWIDTRL